MTIRALALLTALVSIFFFAYGCGARKKSMFKEQLKGDWQVVQLGDLPLQVTPGHMTFSFDFEKGMAGGMGFCNSYGTNFTVSDQGDCSFEAVFSTRVGCDGNREEAQLGINIEKTKKLVIKDDKLLFYDNSEATGEPIIIMMHTVAKTKQ